MQCIEKQQQLLEKQKRMCAEQQQQLEEQNQMYAEQQQQVVAQQEMIERHHESTARVSGMVEILTPGVQALMQKQVEAQEEKMCCNEGESHFEKMRRMERNDDLWIIDLIAVLVVLPVILMRLLKMSARVSWAHRRGACGVLLLGMTSAAQWIVIIFSAVGQLMNELDKAGKRSGVSAALKEGCAMRTARKEGGAARAARKEGGAPRAAQ